MEKKENYTGKAEQQSRQPIIESFISVSADKKWIMHKTIITDIKPVSYMEKVLAITKKA